MDGDANSIGDAHNWSRLRDEGVRAKTECRYEDSCALLQQAWDACPKDRDAVGLGVLLGEVLCMHLAKFAQALEVFEACLSVHSALDPSSEGVFAIRIWQAKTHFYSGRYQEAEAVARQALQTFAASGHSAEHYWSAVFYLFYTLCRQEKSKEAQELFLAWDQKQLRDESELARLIKLQLRALIKRMEENYWEAERLLLEVMQLCASHYATSMFAAINFMTLGIVYHVDMDRFTDAEKNYQASEHIYSKHYPLSLNRAKNFCNLAVLYSDMGRGDDAEAMQLRAHTLLASHYPESSDYMNNLVNLAMRFREVGKVEHAITKRLELHEVYTKLHPEKLEAALNLCHLAELYEKVNRQFEAESQRLAAEQLFSIHHPSSSQRADNLMNLGILYYKLNRRDAAEAQHQLAHGIYAEFHPTSADTAVNLLNWGVVYHNTGRFKEAENKYLAAWAIYEQHHPHVDNAALCAFNLGLLFEIENRVAEALQFVARAVEIWRANGSEEAKSRGLPALTRLQQAAPK